MLWNDTQDVWKENQIQVIGDIRSGTTFIMTGGKNVLLELESEQRGLSVPHKPIVFVTQSASSVGKNILQYSK